MQSGKTIRISNETYQELASQGTLSETFDTVIKKLLQKQEEEVKINA
jgi:predicted CopG family antitoxin